MPKQQDPQWRGISRIDHKHTHGWFARVYLKDRRVLNKLFSDKKYGGKEEALAHARQWRDAQIIPKELRPQPVRYRKKPPKNNTSGRVGVSKTFNRSSGGKGEPLWCFNVSWVPEPYHPKTKSFYISQYASEEEAFRAACEFRAQKEREIDQQQ